MTSAEAADPYLDRTTGLLINRLGLREADRLARQERDASVIRDVEFFRHLAAEAGWGLDWSSITPERNDAASRHSLTGDGEPLRQLLDHITRQL